VTLVDSNVLLDVVTGDPLWAAWSLAQLEAAGLRGRLVINDVVFAEVSVRFGTLEALLAVLGEARITRRAMPEGALFSAGKAFAAYRARGGVRTSVLPDFFIGAHAAVERLPVLTRDARRFRGYFPGVEVIAPER